jgi:hypothetical protein
MAAASPIYQSGVQLITTPAGTELVSVDTGGAVMAVMTSAALAALASSKTGTVIANGVTAVVVADTRVDANSVIIFTLKTASGSAAGGPPFVSAITPGTGFSVKSVANDASTYNYVILN